MATKKAGRTAVVTSARAVTDARASANVAGEYRHARFESRGIGPFSSQPKVRLVALRGARDLAHERLASPTR